MGASESNAEALVEEGLRLYSQGRLDDALEKWRAAIELQPAHPRAEAYIKYVQDNRAALDASFKVVEPQPEATAASKTPSRMQPAAPADESYAIETTGRIGIEELQSRIDESKRSRSSLETPALNGNARNTPATLSPAVVEPLERTRKVTAPTLLPDDDHLSGEPRTLERIRKTTAVTLTEEQRAIKAPPFTVLPGEGRPEGASARARRVTPLTLMPGEGKEEQAHFAPLEQTPVGVEMPEPARLVPTQDGSRRTGRSLEPQQGELPARGASGEQEPDRLESMLAGARQLWEQGTPEGSLWLCERVLAIDPQHAEAKELLARNRNALIEQCRRRIGDMRQVPVVQIPQHEIMWHKLDHRAGFLLSRVDGQLSFEDIIDVSGMEEFETIRILSQLLTLGVIGPRR